MLIVLLLLNCLLIQYFLLSDSMKSCFSTCMNPRSIANPYTFESMVVECGKCPACLLKKSSHYKLLCQLESSVHARTYFVTLTYADAYIPRCEYSDGYLYDSTTGEQLSEEYSY